VESVSNLRNPKLLALSLLIFSFLSLQFIASFRLLCLPDSIARFLPFVRICDPDLWPFLSYPMYSQPHYLGDRIDRPQIFGVLEDQTEIVVSNRDLGIRITQFINIHQTILQTKNKDEILAIADLYERNTGQRLVELSFGYDPVIFTEEGFVPGEPRKLLTIRLDTLGYTK
jgi:hypothetical protein